VHVTLRAADQGQRPVVQSGVRRFNEEEVGAGSVADGSLAWRVLWW